MSRKKTYGETQHDIVRLITQAQLLSVATQKVLNSISECFTFDLVDLHKLHDTNEDFELELRHYYIERVSKEWKPDHSLASRYGP